jgi:hypothetical protein
LLSPRTTLAVVAILAATSMSGCGSSDERDELDFSYAFVRVKPIEYARILCKRVPLVQRHSCMTRVVAHYRDNVNRDLPPDEVTGGPFVAFIDDRLYRGSYRSDPFSAGFSVTDEVSTCRGHYSAPAGDVRPIFQVRCNDGRKGRAQIVLDQSGRNGRGLIEMLDDRGEVRSSDDIVFGVAAAGAMVD